MGAVRRDASMLQHGLTKQTPCQRDCRPLECQKPTFTGLGEPLQSSLSRSQRGNGSTDLRMRCIASVAP